MAKKRTLLFGECGDCPDRDKQYDAAKLIGVMFQMLNIPGSSTAANGPVRDAAVKKYMDGMRATTGNIYLSNADTADEAYAQYLAIIKRCGFNFKK